MRSRLRFWKYPIFIVLLLLVIAAFTLVYALSDTAAAPYERIENDDPVIMETPEPPDEPDEPDITDESEDEPEDEPEEEPVHNPIDDGFIIIDMDEADIHRGPLILVNFENEYKIPEDLDLVNIVEAKSSPYRVQIDNFRLARSIIEPLDDMMNAFISATGNRSVAIISAFRTLNNQQTILNNYISRMGRRQALRWAALPGHSEHHTGLAFDFGILSGGVRTTFDGTGSTAWFRRNSYRFGFIHRFARDKTHITQTEHEPWHFRYVGLPHSRIMFQENWCFEEYHEILRNEHPFETPYEFEHDGVNYWIYFVEGTEIKLPLNCEFDISGNNIDGFIVTAIIFDYDSSIPVEIYI